MSSFKLKAIPAALCAAGMLASGVALAAGKDGIPPALPGVYAQGTFNPTAYMSISRGMYSTSGTTAATDTAGFIMLLLKPTQTAWGYALTTGSGGDSSSGTATLTHTLSTGTTTCTTKYVTQWDAAGVITVSATTLTASPSTATATCKTAFANQTGLSSDMFTPTGSTTSKVFNLIY
jgi:hypothetical protein